VPSEIPRRPIPLLALAILIGIAGCTSEESPTAPSNAASPFVAATGTYHAVDLGTLPGGPVSSAIAINNGGLIVGLSVTASGHEHAVLWKNRAIKDLGTLGGKSSRALALNNFGQIVGSSERADGKVYAFRWSDGVMTDLGTPGGSGSAAYGIDREGRVLVGGADGSVGIWANGVITRLPLPADSPGCTPTGMNPAGRAVGLCLVRQNLRGVLWRPSGIVGLGSLGGFPTSPTAINASGHVVGITRGTPDLGSRPFLWYLGSMIDLSAQGAPRGLIPNAINVDGAIVGVVGSGGAIHAILFQQGTTIDLGALLPGVDSYAFGINSTGDVVGHSGTATLWTRQ